MLVLVVLAWSWSSLRAFAVTGVSYGVRVACPCRFIAGRDLASCKDDFRSGFGPLWLSEDAEDKSVTAWSPLLASQTATFREGQGCVLETWDD